MFFYGNVLGNDTVAARPCGARCNLFSDECRNRQLIRGRLSCVYLFRLIELCIILCCLVCLLEC